MPGWRRMASDDFILSALSASAGSWSFFRGSLGLLLEAKLRGKSPRGPSTDDSSEVLFADVSSGFCVVLRGLRVAAGERRLELLAEVFADLFGAAFFAVTDFFAVEVADFFAAITLRGPDFAFFAGLARRTFEVALTLRAPDFGDADFVVFLAFDFAVVILSSKFGFNSLIGTVKTIPTTSSELK